MSLNFYKFSCSTIKQYGNFEKIHFCTNRRPDLKSLIPEHSHELTNDHQNWLPPPPSKKNPKHNLRLDSLSFALRVGRSRHILQAVRLLLRYVLYGLLAALAAQMALSAAVVAVGRQPLRILQRAGIDIRHVRDRVADEVRLVRKLKLRRPVLEY